MTLRPAPLTRLSQANPRIVDGWLRFDCPFHTEHDEIAIPLVPLPNGWGVTDRDDFEKITITPSIKVTNVVGQCWWHGFIQHGGFVHCNDSR
jgi:hypothetical protein